MQINRLFEIIYILLNKKTITARELSEYFGVSRRTICRDVDTLSLAGIPIYTERGRGGGISLLPDFVLNKSILNEHEQNEILSALHSLSNIKADDTSQILRKLSTVFNKTTINWIEVDYVGWSHENDYFNNFKLAILERRIAKFDYYNSQGDKIIRRVEPIQLWFKSKSWYLKAFCLTKQEMRLFKLSRIKDLVVTDEHFAERDTPAIYCDPVQESFHNQQKERIKLLIEPEMAFRVFDDFYESMVERQKDGSFLITVEWPEDIWLYNFILSFGKHIEVLEPEHLKNTIKEQAQKIYEKYS
ncbi:helix-turn-helix transcriptional regulator [uncultured Robinsoniella sp.]|uniref:helix-turn-helix transcriptional regulator n=1 Tax=uncultured Robinsoniella sp. TaxID=904190 RepID=UPI00374F4DE1